MTDHFEYDAADDARKSYDAAIEAKRLRGDRHYPSRPSPEPKQERLFGG